MFILFQVSGFKFYWNVKLETIFVYCKPETKKNVPRETSCEKDTVVMLNLKLRFFYSSFL